MDDQGTEGDGCAEGRHVEVQAALDFAPDEADASERAAFEAHALCELAILEDKISLTGSIGEVEGLLEGLTRDVVRSSALRKADLTKITPTNPKVVTDRMIEDSAALSGCRR